MNSLSFKLEAEPGTVPFLLTVRGQLAAPDLEAARKTHNLVAGSPQAIAAARSLSDLSHAVYVPVTQSSSGQHELLILDYWNNPEGLQRFFADPRVAEGGAALFKSREASVWAATPGMPSVHFPPPMGRHQIWAGLFRGLAKSREKAPPLLTEYTRLGINKARARGLLCREFYFRASAPGEAPSAEFLGLDLWFDADGMKEHYSDPENAQIMADVLSGRPETSAWCKPQGEWIEW